MSEREAPAPTAGGAGVALADLLDRLLDRGVVVAGDLRIGVADVDLLYLGLRLIVAPADQVPGAGRAAGIGEGA